MAKLKIYTDENVDIKVIFVEMNKMSVGGCIRRLALYADILTPDEMKNQIEFL